MQDLHTLQIWQKSHELTLKVYSMTKSCFPKDKLFALTSQIRRSSSSIACNIAEGTGRKSKADFSHFLQRSIGLCSEVEYQLLLAKDLGVLDKKLFKDTFELQIPYWVDSQEVCIRNIQNQ